VFVRDWMRLIAVEKIESGGDDDDDDDGGGDEIGSG
jgi:hypothetical protein